MSGTYAEIVEVVAPGSAAADSTVSVEVKVKNKHSSTIGIMVGGALDYGVTPWPGIGFPDYSANVEPGATRTFYGSFKMPSKAVTIHAYSYWYGSDGSWHFDDERTKKVNLAELAAAISQFQILDYSKV